MANSTPLSCSISFSDFPEDVQLCILSFLSLSDLSNVASTSKPYFSLFHTNCNLWYAMCDRKWGSKTQIEKWCNGKSSFKRLYKILSKYEDLIGFWRESGGTTGAPLVFFEWGSSCIVGSSVSPSKRGTYNVIKSPFIWMSLSDNGDLVNYLNPDLSSDDSDLVQVNVSFLGKGHVIIEENREHGVWLPVRPWSNLKNTEKVEVVGQEVLGSNPGTSSEAEIGSPPDHLMSEMYQHFANRMSPGAGGERAWRKQRRREKERRRWRTEHFIRIFNCSPTPSRPLQGLWKGISEDMSLDFYHVTYDDIGGIACRRVGDASRPSSHYMPVFWTSDPTFIESPLSPEEDYLYNTRVHIRPPMVAEYGTNEHSYTAEYGSVSRIMYINSSYDLVIPSLAGVSVNPQSVEGRVWLYEDGTFGFGFLRDNLLVDLKRIAVDGRILDAGEFGVA